MEQKVIYLGNQICKVMQSFICSSSSLKLYKISQSCPQELIIIQNT